MTHSKLFAPLALGSISLTHRVVMAPLTRLRAEVPGDVPGSLMLEYYAQRASQGGLIITEATTISRKARGYLGAPGIYTLDQVAGWRAITDAVHAKGGRIVLQLWHVGRSSHAEFLDGDVPVSASQGIPYDAKVFTSQGWIDVTPNRTLKVEEIPPLLDDYLHAAANASSAGFDGVEIHAGNGYLLDQFLQDGSNRRTDLYGGSVNNRTRLVLEVVDTVLQVWDSSRVGLRISPSTQFNGMHDSNPSLLFSSLSKALSTRELGWLHVIEPRISGNTEVAHGLAATASADLRPHFSGKIIAAGGFDGNSGADIIEAGTADAVAFGRFFIANPDLPLRLSQGAPLNPYDRSTFYGGDAHGYTDYPTLASTLKPLS